MAGKDTCNTKPFSTPCYIIDLEQFDENVKCLQSGFLNEWGTNIILGYSIKTNHLPLLLKHAKLKGFFAEAVSGDEYYHAISQGYEPKHIIFNGPQKDKETLIKAINEGSIVNIDNFQDIKIIEENLIDIKIDKSNVGIRVNFDLESICKGETTSGEEVSRFGICIENGDFERALLYLKKLDIPVRGLHLHYSTKSRSLAVFKALARKAAELIVKFNMQDKLMFVDIGGGFWGGRRLPNKPTMQEYSNIIANELKKVVSPKDVQLILEPGASIVATAVSYLTKVINTRMIRDTKIVTVDGSMLHINPFMIKRQQMFSTNSSSRENIRKQVICGSSCMENDRLLHLNNYNEFRIDDILTFYNAGAYTMSYNNCFINNPPYIYVKENNQYTKVRGKLTGLMEQI